MSKKKYYEEQLIKYKHDSKLTWRIPNEILNMKLKNKELPKTFLTNSNKTTNDPKAIANKFNEYVTNTGPSLAENIEKRSDTNFEKYLTDNYQNSMFIVPIDLRSAYVTRFQCIYFTEICDTCFPYCIATHGLTLA